jgi:SAM-dependent methyltransferase
MKLCCDCSRPFDGEDWCCPQCGWQPAAIDGCLAFAPQSSSHDGGFAEDYFPRLARMEAGHFWLEARNELLIWAVREYFPEMRSMLEIGCGTGFVLRALGQSFPGARLAGSEIFSAGLRFASGRVPNGELFQMDARRIPFRDEFDVLGAFDVLEHIEEDEAVLGQMYGAVRPGGGILLTVPQHPGLWSASDDYAFHKRRYTRSELVGKVRAAGFVQIRTTSFVTLLLPMMWASRLRSRRYTGDFDPAAEFSLNPILNRWMLAVMRVERQLIRAVSLPAGGSLLLVANRR